MYWTPLTLRIFDLSTHIFVGHCFTSQIFDETRGHSFNIQTLIILEYNNYIEYSTQIYINYANPVCRGQSPFEQNAEQEMCVQGISLLAAITIDRC